MDIDQASMKMVQAWRNFKTEPVKFPNKILGLPNQWIWEGVQRMIQSVFENRKTAVQAGHAMSKDWTAGVLALMWLLIHWGRAKVIVTAPTSRQVKDVIFKEIESEYNRLRTRFPEFRKDWLTSTHLEFSPECFATGFTTKETNEMVGKFQGFHSPNMLIIISEAQAVAPDVFKQIRGLMTSPNSRLLELGNPIVPFGDFYEHCTNPKYGYEIIHLPVSMSPNIVHGREVIPGMCSRTWLVEFQEELGPGYDEDPDYQSRALANFPEQSAHAWIPLSKIKLAVNKRFRDADKLRVGGLDPAGEGDDETVHCVLEGPAMLKQDCFRKVLTPETVGWARGIIEDEVLEGLAIDEGYNPGIRDWLNFERMPVTGVNFGGESPNPKFANMGTYIWSLLRRAIMEEGIGIINDPILIYQLSSRKIERLPNGKLKLESKKKSGRKSPDRADALALAWYLRILMIGGEDSMSDAGSENEATQMDNDINRRLKSSRAIVREEVEMEDDVGVSGAMNLEADEIPD